MARIWALALVAAIAVGVSVLATRVPSIGTAGDTDPAGAAREDRTTAHPPLESPHRTSVERALGRAAGLSEGAPHIRASAGIAGATLETLSSQAPGPLRAGDLNDHPVQIGPTLDADDPRIDERESAPRTPIDIGVPLDASRPGYSDDPRDPVSIGPPLDALDPWAPARRAPPRAEVGDPLDARAGMD